VSNDALFEQRVEAAVEPHLDEAGLALRDTITQTGPQTRRGTGNAPLCSVNAAARTIRLMRLRQVAHGEGKREELDMAKEDEDLVTATAGGQP